MKDDRKSALREISSELIRSGDSQMEDARSEAAARVGPVQYKRGGKVRRTGMAKVHAGERVIPSGKRKKVERMMKRGGMRLTNR